MKITVVGINARYTHSCLALFYVREALLRAVPSADVVIRQFTINDPLYDIVQRLTDEGTDYLLFSTVIWNSDLIERIIADLLVLPSYPRIVVGGPQADIVGSRFANHDCVSVFVGAIEAAEPDFFEDIRRGTMSSRYQAYFFRLPGRAFASPYRAEDFSAALLHRSVYYESSRGCPFSCTYCLSSAEHGLSHKDVAQVREELTAILAHHPKTVRFVDRTFNDVPDRALAIWRFLAELDTETLFHFELAPDRFNEDLFVFLETVPAGRFQFEIGLQSTHRPTLAAIRRSVDPQVAAAAIQRLRRIDTIRLHVDLILGLPYETEDAYFRSINDVFAMKPHYIQMGLLKILPGTEMARDTEGYGYRFSPSPPYPVYVNRWLSPARLRDLYRLGQCIEHFVNNRYFVSLWQYLVDSGENMALFFSGLAGLFLDRGYVFMAATQETLSSLLLELLLGRKDARLCTELLIYDWLRCGHRFLPDHLRIDEINDAELRKDLYQVLPEQHDGLYRAVERNHFIRTHVFKRFSGEALRLLGFSGGTGTGIVCFSPEREQTVFRLCRTTVVAA